MIKSFFSLVLALLLCVTALASTVLAAGPAYTVAAMPDGVPDPDVLAVLHLDKNLDFAVNRDSDFSVDSSFSYSSTDDVFGYSLQSSSSDISTLTISSASGFSDFSSFCLDFRLKLKLTRADRFVLSTTSSAGSSSSSSDFLFFDRSFGLFLNSDSFDIAGSLESSLNNNVWHTVRFAYIDGSVFMFVDGTLLCSGTYLGNPVSCLYFYHLGSACMIDEIILTTGKYTENLTPYTPATTPFEVPLVPSLPDSPVANCIYVQTDISPESVQIGGDVPADPALGFVHVATSPDNTAEFIQIYDGSVWSSVSAQIYADSGWHDVIGYSFSAAPGADDPPGDADDYSFLDKPFDDYTTTEGLLLSLLLCAIVSAVITLLKEGFYWLW